MTMSNCSNSPNVKSLKTKLCIVEVQNDKSCLCCNRRGVVISAAIQVDAWLMQGSILEVDAPSHVRNMIGSH